MENMASAKNTRRDGKQPRKLVRWDDEKDMLCYLAIPRVLAKRNIKIPWGEVAAYVGDTVSGKFTTQYIERSSGILKHYPQGNALLQHMTKLCKKRAQQGFVVPQMREPVGDMRDYPCISSAGFGDRRGPLVVSPKIGPDNVKLEECSEEDDGNDSADGLIDAPHGKEKASRSGHHSDIKKAPKAAPINFESEVNNASSDDDDESISAQSGASKSGATHNNGARAARKRSRAPVADPSDTDAENKMPQKKGKKANNLKKPAAKVDLDSPETPKKIVTLRFQEKMLEFAQKIHELEASQTGSLLSGDGQEEKPSMNAPVSMPTIAQDVTTSNFEAVHGLGDLYKETESFSDSDISLGDDHIDAMPLDYDAEYIDPVLMDDSATERMDSLQDTESSYGQINDDYLFDHGSLEQFSSSSGLSADELDLIERSIMADDVIEKNPFQLAADRFRDLI